MKKDKCEDDAARYYNAVENNLNNQDADIINCIRNGCSAGEESDSNVNTGSPGPFEGSVEDALDTSLANLDITDPDDRGEYGLKASNLSPPPNTVLHYPKQTTPGDPSVEPRRKRLKSVTEQVIPGEGNVADERLV